MNRMEKLGTRFKEVSSIEFSELLDVGEDEEENES